MIAAPKLNVGHAVQLKSGGTAMTIISIDGDIAECVWMDRTGRDRSRNVPLTALMHDQSSTHGTLIIEGYNATKEEIADLKNTWGLGNA